MTDPNVVWGTAVAVVGLAGYVFGWYSHPRFRKGCHECETHVRQSREREREAVHDLDHRGFDSPGHPTPYDVYECQDVMCPRNEEVRQRRAGKRQN